MKSPNCLFLILLCIFGLMILVTGCSKPPSITNVDPTTVSTAGGTEITITGTNFKSNPATTVTIGGNLSTKVKVISKTTLKAEVPSGIAGVVDIVVQNAKVKSLPFKGFTYFIVPDIQGYKNAQWGINDLQVATDLNITLHQYGGIGIFGTKPINGAFLELWGVPKSELFGRVGYSESLVPESSFQCMETPNGDRCLFYDGKFCAYYFGVSAKNYDSYYSNTVSKYSNPLESKSFPGYDLDGTERFSITVNMWNAGGL
jgi:hypothetical protein